MTRQYIGARYVVKIYENSSDPTSAEWEANVNYEPLTMVTYNYGSYLSKKTVPASVGNPASNGSYWVQTGFYNGQIASLQSQINNLSDEVSNLANRKYVFVSDSYGASVVPELVSLLGLSSNDYVNIQRGGSAFGNTYGTELNWQTMIESTTTVNDETYTDVVYIGGVNEGSNLVETVTTNAMNCYDYVKSRFVNAKQWYMLVSHASGGSADTYGIDTNIRTRRRIPFALNATNRNFIYNECWYPMADRNNQGTDYLHPTTNGAKLIAEEIASALNGGKVFYVTDMYNAITLDTTDTGNTVNWFQCNIWRENSHVHGIFRANSIDLGTSTNITSTGTDIILGKINSDLIRGGNNTSNGTCDLYLGSTIALVTDTSNVQYSLCCKVYLTADNELKFNFTPAWSTTPPITAKNIDFRYFEFDVDSYVH